MKKIAWISYGGLTLILQLSALVAVINAGTVVIGSFVSLIFTSIYLAGLYGYVYEKAIWKPRVWRTLFWLNVAIMGLRIVLLFLSPNADLVSDVLFSSLFSLPLLYCLYKYSAESFAAWNE